MSFLELLFHTCPLNTIPYLYTIRDNGALVSYTTKFRRTR